MHCSLHYANYVHYYHIIMLRRRAIDRKTRKTVALKKIFDAFQNSTDAQRTYREIMFLQELNSSRHTHIIRLLNVLKADNDRDIYLVFEYMEINLHSVIRAGILQDIHKRYIIYQILRALKYMHSGLLLHRDLKPSNILLNADCSLKLCDFGLARSLVECDGGTNTGNSTSNESVQVLTDYVATRWYRAPEILLGSHQYSTAVDVWSMGCILAEVLSSQPLFPGDSTMNQLERILEVTGEPTYQQMMSIKSKHTLTMCENLTIRPQKSYESMFPTAPSDAIDLLNKLLQFSPDQRISIDQAIKHPYVAQFHDSANEPVCMQPIPISIDDNKRYSISEYRKNLYRRIVERKKEIRQKRSSMMNNVTRSTTTLSQQNQRSNILVASNSRKTLQSQNNKSFHNNTINAQMTNNTIKSQPVNRVLSNTTNTLNNKKVFK